MSRLEILHQWYQDDPHDPFNGYALAMEYLAKEPSKAKFYFDQLLDQYPQYLPTYYHAASLYVEIEDFGKAIQIYEKGLELALNQGNIKTYQELRRAYKQLQDELDE